MKRTYCIVAALLLVAGRLDVACGQEAPSYAKQVRPLLAKYCSECHNARTFKAGLDLDSVKGINEGSDRGPVLVPGKPDESKLVVLTEGKKEPKMPPKKARLRPTPAEVAVLRAWVKAGAKDDSSAQKTSIPDIKPRVPVASPVTALAYEPQGKRLAAAGYRTIRLLDVATGKEVNRLKDLPQPVTTLTFSRDGSRLAVGCGEPGMPATVLLYAVPPAGQPWPAPLAIPAAHTDAILDMDFAPDGKLLATAGYDTTIKFWDPSTGKELRTLKEHSDSVYGISFNADGTLLASGAADRAVKVWDVSAGKLLYTFAEPTDWIYSVAWSPDGLHLAAAGVDKSIRIWRTGQDKGRLVHSVFAHEAPVIRLRYAADGKTLYSLGEDRIVKAWEAGRLVERKIYTRQPETTLVLAVRPDGKQLALGRYDGALVLLDEASGATQLQIGEPATPATKQKQGPASRPAKPMPPQVKKVTPDGGQRGRPIRLRFEGAHLDDVVSLSANHSGVATKLLTQPRSATALHAEITFPATTPAGKYELTLTGKSGKAGPLAFTVDLFPQVKEKEPNDAPGHGQPILLPASVAGALAKAGDVDYYRFEASAGQQVGVQLVAEAAAKLSPLLELTDATGKVLAQTNDGVLGYTFRVAGAYALGVRDQELRGGPGMAYRLHIGDIPVVTSIFPLGLRRGSEADIRIEGVHLGGISKVRVKAPADAAIGSKLPVPVNAPAGVPLGLKSVVVGEFPEVMSRGTGPAGAIPVPGTANGILRDPGQTDLWSFHAHKGQKLILEVNARRLGSPVDSFIEVLDAANRPVARATLRCVAKTHVTFRDHDSASAGIRIEAWDDLAVNDFVHVGNELLRIRALPPNPDADCTFFSDRGQRVGYLDTTPTHLSNGTPMYKVEAHPAGMTFAPNGYPVITLYYRNDDGGPGYGRDSRISFDAPADGEYRVRIGDARGQGGSDHAYRLTIRPPRPSFNVSFTPTSPAVARGSATPIAVTAERSDGYEGEIALRLENLPAGFSAPASSIAPGDNSTVVALFADPLAMKPAKSAGKLKLIAHARIDGQDVIREVAGGVPTLIEPGDLVTTTEKPEVSVKPGQKVRLTVNIERRNGFKGRVPLDVRGLPHGVRVLDIGLNGILINEQETRRTIVIFAEPWVQPTSHPFVVLSRREGKNTEHAARSVLLRVVAP